MTVLSSTIGRCIGCTQPASLDEGVCKGCLKTRGRRFAELACRCRRDPYFASRAFTAMAPGRYQRRFMEDFGRVFVMLLDEFIADGRAEWVRDPRFSRVRAANDG